VVHKVGHGQSRLRGFTTAQRRRAKYDGLNDEHKMKLDHLQLRRKSTKNLHLDMEVTNVHVSGRGRLRDDMKGRPLSEESRTSAD